MRCVEQGDNVSIITDGLGMLGGYGIISRIVTLSVGSYELFSVSFLSWTISPIKRLDQLACGSTAADVRSNFDPIKQSMHLGTDFPTRLSKETH